FFSSRRRPTRFDCDWSSDVCASDLVNLGVSSDRFDVLLDAAKHGLRQAWRRGRTATHMHLIASGLRRGPWQQSLFDPPADKLERSEERRVGKKCKTRSGASPWRTPP